MLEHRLAQAEPMRASLGRHGVPREKLDRGNAGILYLIQKLGKQILGTPRREQAS